MDRPTEAGLSGPLRVGIVDSQLCNLGSILNAVRSLGAEPVRLAAPEEITACHKLLLPGVETFGQGMDNLRRLGFIDPLREAVLGRGTEILGICLGMQLLASEGAGKETDHVSAPPSRHSMLKKRLVPVVLVKQAMHRAGIPVRHGTHAGETP